MSMQMNPSNHSSILLLTDSIFAQQAGAELQAIGYVPILAKVQQGWQNLAQHQPVMIILDRVLTGKGGLELCRQIRNSGERIPILILVEQETVAERVACLEAGADDYLLKPYSSEKLLEQIHLYLQPEINLVEQLRFGELILDLNTRQVIRKDRAIDLTMKEFELLKYLKFDVVNC